MGEAYTDIVLDHFNHPRNVGMLEDPDAVGRAENPVSGATIALYLRILDGQIQFLQIGQGIMICIIMAIASNHRVQSPDHVTLIPLREE